MVKMSEGARSIYLNEKIEAARLALETARKDGNGYLANLKQQEILSLENQLEYEFPPGYFLG
jgi:hypothetical protein